MVLGKVIGTVVATRKEEELVGLKLLLVSACDADGKPSGAPVVAVDAVGAGVGEVVLYASRLVGAADQGHQRSPGRRHDHGHRRRDRGERRKPRYPKS